MKLCLLLLAVAVVHTMAIVHTTAARSPQSLHPRGVSHSPQLTRTSCRLTLPQSKMAASASASTLSALSATRCARAGALFAAMGSINGAACDPSLAMRLAALFTTVATHGAIASRSLISACRSLQVHFSLAVLRTLGMIRTSPPLRAAAALSIALALCSIPGADILTVTARLFSSIKETPAKKEAPAKKEDPAKKEAPAKGQKETIGTRVVPSIKGETPADTHKAETQKDKDDEVLRLIETAKTQKNQNDEVLINDDEMQVLRLIEITKTQRNHEVLNLQPIKRLRTTEEILKLIKPPPTKVIEALTMIKPAVVDIEPQSTAVPNFPVFGVAATSDAATVETSDAATVETSDAATVKTSDAATVETPDAATVETSDAATVETSHAATVEIPDAATVEVNEQPVETHSSAIRQAHEQEEVAKRASVNVAAVTNPSSAPHQHRPSPQVSAPDKKPSVPPKISRTRSTTLPIRLAVRDCPHHVTVQQLLHEFPLASSAETVFDRRTGGRKSVVLFFPSAPGLAERRKARYTLEPVMGKMLPEAGCYAVTWTRAKQGAPESLVQTEGTTAN